MTASCAWLAATVSASLRTSRRAALRGDRGEGVISVAIAVLIMAFLGAAMWATFNGVWKDVETNVETQMQTIGKDGAGSGGAPATP